MYYALSALLLTICMIQGEISTAIQCIEIKNRDSHYSSNLKPDRGRVIYSRGQPPLIAEVYGHHELKIQGFNDLVGLFKSSNIAKAPAKIINIKHDARMLAALGAD